MIFRILVGVVAIIAALLLYQVYGYRYVLNDIRETASPATMMGPSGAPINLVVYLDYGSSWSRRVNPVLLQLLSENQDVNMIIRPYAGISDNSEFASRLALAAIQDNNFLDVHAILMEAPNDLNKDYIKRAFQMRGLNYDVLANRTDDPAITDMVEEIKREALLLSIDKTPQIYIEHIALEGGYSFPEMEKIVQDIRYGYR